MSETKIAQVTNEQTELFRDLDKPSLHALSYALRHPDTWPEGFIWNYGSCHSCAMGLAHELWRSAVPETERKTAASIMARTFAMPYGDAKNIFLGSIDWLPTDDITKGHLWWKQEFQRTNHDRVTPEMVADQIDAYLARAE